MARVIVTTLTTDELADLLAPRLADRLEAEWLLRTRKQGEKPAKRKPAQGPRKAAGAAEEARENQHE